MALVELKCLYNNTHSMSENCLNTSINYFANCFPYNDKNGVVVATIAGILCTINAIVGFFGNLLTILAIPYAASKNKYVISWQNLVVFMNILFFKYV